MVAGDASSLAGREEEMRESGGMNLAGICFLEVERTLAERTHRDFLTTKKRAMMSGGIGSVHVHARSSHLLGLDVFLHSRCLNLQHMG